MARKTLLRYLVHRPNNGRREIWLNEEGRPLGYSGVQSLVQRLKERAENNGSGSVHRFRHTFARISSE